MQRGKQPSTLALVSIFDNDQHWRGQHKPCPNLLNILRRVKQQPQSAKACVTPSGTTSLSRENDRMGPDARMLYGPVDQSEHGLTRDPPVAARGFPRCKLPAFNPELSCAGRYAQQVSGLRSRQNIFHINIHCVDQT